MNEKQAKYTPGPWHWDGDELWHVGYDYSDKHNPHLYTSVDRNRELAKTKISQANATLIAAAPELFELGRAAVADTCGSCPETYDSPWCNSHCDMRPFRDIIERLEGEVLDL